MLRMIHLVNILLILLPHFYQSDCVELPCASQTAEIDNEYNDLVGDLLRIAGYVNEIENEWDILADLSMRKYECLRNDKILHRITSRLFGCAEFVSKHYEAMLYRNFDRQFYEIRCKQSNVVRDLEILCKQLSNETVETMAIDYPEKYRLLKSMIIEMMHYCLLADKICWTMNNEGEEFVRKVNISNMVSLKAISLAFTNAELALTKPGATAMLTSSRALTTTMTEVTVTIAKEEVKSLDKEEEESDSVLPSPENLLNNGATLRKVFPLFLALLYFNRHL